MLNEGLRELGYVEGKSCEIVARFAVGGDASSIPIQQVSRIGLTLNMPAARALDLGVPQSIPLRADKSIE